MNSQIFPGLSESFIRQEHARLLEEAARSRLLQQVKIVQPARRLWFLFHWMPNRPKPLRGLKPKSHIILERR